jgi:hypothetical protein
VGLNELARALSQSIVAEPLAGLAGIYGTATGGVGEGVRLIDKVREKVGYQPETKDGIRNLDALARALSPVNNALEKARTTLGDGAFNATGSPALAAAAYTAPDAILSALGARPAMAAGRSAQAGIGRAVRRASELPSPTMGSPASQIGAIRAYHGTPHDFDRFSMDKIGTGEGAQAYGHGLYFAGAKDIAKHYQEALTKQDALTVRVGSKIVAQGDAITDSQLKAIELLERGERDAGQFKHNRAYYAKRLTSDPEVLALIDQWKDSRITYERPKGNLYEVELAPDETDLLDWDAPLSQQPEKMRAAYESFLQTELAKQADDSLGGALTGRIGQYADPRGQDFYGAIFEAMPGMGMPARAGVTDELRKLGIPGIRYLDGGSRAAGDGSRNYVMFDDSLIKILGKK